MRKFFIIRVISVQHTPYFFPAFFVENIFERGIVFSYVWKYFELGMLNFVRSLPSFFATFSAGIFFELRIVFFYLWKLKLVMVNSVRNPPSFFQHFL